MSTEPEKQAALPDIAKFYFAPEKLANYSFAMADVICWLAGFTAAGGSYSPGSIETLRNIKDAFDSIREGSAKSNLSHK